MAGSGSLSQLKNGGWRLRISDGFKTSGKRITHSRNVPVMSRAQANRELAKFLVEVDSGSYVENSKLKFEEYSSLWLQDHAEPNLKDKTVQDYRKLLKRILPELGNIRLSEIRPIRIERFYITLQSEGNRSDGKPGKISGNTAHHYHRLLSKMLNDAVRWGYLKTNPVEKVSAPTIKKKEAKHYTMSEVDAVLRALVDEGNQQYTAIVHLALFGGLRRGEVLGLLWEDVDFDNSSIRISRSCQYVKGKGTFLTSVKTETSVRTVVMPTSTMALLRQHKTHQTRHRLELGDRWHANNLVFATLEGQLMHPDTLSKWMRRFTQRNGLPPVPFHGLRHTSATVLINEGTNIKSVSSRLGHRDVTTTLNTYAHALKSTDQVAADTFDKLLNSGFEDRKKKL